MTLYWSSNVTASLISSLKCKQIVTHKYKEHGNFCWPIRKWSWLHKEKAWQVNRKWRANWPAGRLACVLSLTLSVHCMSRGWTEAVFIRERPCHSKDRLETWKTSSTAKPLGLSFCLSDTNEDKLTSASASVVYHSVYLQKYLYSLISIYSLWVV